ncbi:MAG: DUF1735 domain-containing protein [Bacteroidales bacterium]|nr:DUF1735 domain-containing protein [Bacteroidales bacterium]
MKNYMKYLVLAAAAAFTLSACENEDIPEYENIRGFETVTGDFAYIVGATMPRYDNVTCEIQHTPIGELGTIAKTFEVALTAAQPQDVKLTLATDDSRIDADAEAIPENLFTYDKNVTIAKGETKAEVTVTLDNANFSQLTASKYMAAFVIKEADGVQVSSNSNLALLTVLTEVIDPTKNMITVSGGTSTYEITNYLDVTRGDNISKRISITGTEPAFQAFDVVFEVDNSLIEAYNAEHGTSYVAVPDGMVSLSNATMAKDAKSTSTTVSIPQERNRELTDENGYLIPVVCTGAYPATLKDAPVTYLVINVTNVNAASNQFAALYLGDYRMATWYQFAKPLSMNSWTIVFHCFIDEKISHARIGDFADKSENFINMLRLGERGGTELQWFVGPNGNRKQLYTNALEVGKWYCIALAYNGDEDQLKLFVDGEQVASESADFGTFDFQAIEFNSSWGAGYRQGNEFHGRLWNVSVWSSDISNDPYGWGSTLSEIIKTDISQGWYFNYYKQDWGGGLKAYWLMDEGKGAILNDKVGYENIDFSNTVRCDNETDMVPADVSAYVQWKRDEHNVIDEL